MRMGLAERSTVRSEPQFTFGGGMVPNTEEKRTRCDCANRFLANHERDEETEQRRKPKRRGLRAQTSVAYK